MKNWVTEGVASDVNGLIKVDLEFSFSIPGLFQTWNSDKPGFEKLNSRSEPVFEKLNSRSERALRKKQYLTEKKVLNLGFIAQFCRKPKTSNQQLLRNKLELELKYEVNLRFETQI